jgi:hypothetical protein
MIEKNMVTTPEMRKTYDKSRLVCLQDAYTNLKDRDDPDAMHLVNAIDKAGLIAKYNLK